MGSCAKLYPLGWRWNCSAKVCYAKLVVYNYVIPERVVPAEPIIGVDIAMQCQCVLCQTSGVHTGQYIAHVIEHARPCNHADLVPQVVGGTEEERWLPPIYQ